MAVPLYLVQGRPVPASTIHLMFSGKTERGQAQVFMCTTPSQALVHVS